MLHLSTLLPALSQSIDSADRNEGGRVLSWFSERKRGGGGDGGGGNNDNASFTRLIGPIVDLEINKHCIGDVSSFREYREKKEGRDISNISFRG